MITALTVNYNTPDVLDRLLSSFRKYYDIPFLVIDGSDSDNYKKIIRLKRKYEVKIIHFPYNIHHGPGMAFGIKYIHPACTLINREIVLKFPLPASHGAPMIYAMRTIHDKELSDDLLIHEPWITNDFRKSRKKFIIHDWKGTVDKTVGYHFDNR